MAYDPQIHHRRSIRWRAHNYGGGGAYFITCCVRGKGCLFGRVAEAAMLINKCGEVVQRAWYAIPQRFSAVTLDAFQIMPNHLHGILAISGSGLDPSLAAAISAPEVGPGLAPGLATASRLAPPHAGPAVRNSPGSTKKPSLGDVMGAFKSISTIAVNRLLSRRGALLQEDYFEHVIRNVGALEKIRDYIRTNPRDGRMTRKTLNGGRSMIPPTSGVG